METLIQRIYEAMGRLSSLAEIAEHFAKDASPEEIFLAYHAARILDRDRTPKEA